MSRPVPTAELAAEVLVSIDYRDDAFDVAGIVGELVRTHGASTPAALEPETYRALVARHAR